MCMIYHCNCCCSLKFVVCRDYFDQSCPCNHYGKHYTMHDPCSNWCCYLICLNPNASHEITSIMIIVVIWLVPNTTLVFIIFLVTITIHVGTAIVDILIISLFNRSFQTRANWFDTHRNLICFHIWHWFLLELGVAF